MFEQKAGLYMCWVSLLSVELFSCFSSSFLRSSSSSSFWMASSSHTLSLSSLVTDGTTQGEDIYKAETDLQQAQVCKLFFFFF